MGGGAGGFEKDFKDFRDFNDFGEVPARRFSSRSLAHPSLQSLLSLHFAPPPHHKLIVFPLAKRLPRRPGRAPLKRLMR